MNNAFEELTNRLNWAKNKTSELDDILIESINENNPLT